MKRITIFVLFSMVFLTSVHSQDFNSYMTKGKDFFDRGDYLSSFDQFNLAYDAAEADSAESDATNWKTKSMERLKKILSNSEKIKSNTDAMLRIALNEPKGTNTPQEKLYEVCKNKGISNYNKKLYFDAYQYLKMAKLCPDYNEEAEVESYIKKSVNALDTLKKIALVIGNANYIDVNMEKAITDAKDVAKALASMNFKVMTGLNLRTSEFDLAVKQFFDSAKNCDIVFFFYTGYGYQSDYLLPIDTKIDDEGNLKKWFSLNFLLNEFPKNFNSKKIFVLDIDRSSKKGIVPAVMSYRNSLVVFSAAPNNAAFNGVGRNSLFTEQFLKFLTMKNTSFQEIFRLTREATMRVSKERQVPTIYDNIQNNLYLNWKIE